MSCSGREDRIPSATEERGHRDVSRTLSDEGCPQGERECQGLDDPEAWNSGQWAAHREREGEARP